MKRKPNTARILFCIYVLILIWIVVFKTAVSFSEIPWFTAERRVNLIPFHYENNTGRFHFREVLLNIAVFVPFGVYLKMFDFSLRKTAVFGCAFSFVLEFFQVAAAIGAGDITDIITNTLGTFAGACLYLLAGKIFADKAKTDRMINAAAAAAEACFCGLAILLVIAN